MALLDHIIVLIIVVLVPLNQYLGRDQFLAMKEFNCTQRISVYWNMIVVQCVMLLFLLSFWWVQFRPLAPLGLSAPNGLRFWFGAGVAILSLVGLGLYYRSQLGDQAKRNNLRELADRMVPFLPRTKRALMHFNVLCLTAGVVEELIFRGFFFWYATRFMGDSIGSLIGTVFLTSIIFSLGHLYQGRRGLGTVFSVGMLYGGVYVLSGSLWVPMFMHAIMDLMGGRMGFLLHLEVKNAIEVEDSEIEHRKAA